MPNYSLIAAIPQLPKDEWASRCIRLLNESDPSSITYVGQGGKRNLTGYVPDVAWGIDAATCRAHCNSGQLPLRTSFQDFASAFVNYLLPWLGLIAQLPVETGERYDAFVSLAMSIGSPALITYSLMLTIRNRYLVRTYFDSLRRLHLSDVEYRYPGFGSKLDNIQYVLEESQQVPLRMSQESGWFSSLLVANQNDEWWKNVRKSLANTRRGSTLSLVFQLAVAIIAWLFTVIAAFVSSLGSITTGLQITAGSLWIWMIPVILGWITVGTQQLSRSVDDALETKRAHLALPTPGSPHPGQQRSYTEPHDQRGLRPTEEGEDGLRPFNLASPGMASADHEISAFANMRGDEKRRGPAFNYARIFAYCHLVGCVRHALKCSMENMAHGRACDLSRRWNRQDVRASVEGNAAQTEEYCGLEKGVYAYPEWNEIPQYIWIGMGFSALVALFLQWGTTGAAVMMAFLTPVQGVGCRSGSYILYGSAATVSCFLLAISNLLSHETMLRHQRDRQKSPAPNRSTGSHADNGHATSTNVGNARSTNTPPQIDTITEEETIELTPFGTSGSYAANGHVNAPANANNTEYNPVQTTGRSHRRRFEWVPVRGLAASTRYCGKGLAILNAFFLVTISLAEFIGGFDNCWCKADTVDYGPAGWVVLFKDADDLAENASLPWGLGIAMSVLVCIISGLIFWGGRRKRSFSSG